MFRLSHSCCSIGLLLIAGIGGCAKTPTAIQGQPAVQPGEVIPVDQTPTSSITATDDAVPVASAADVARADIPPKPPSDSPLQPQDEDTQPSAAESSESVESEPDLSRDLNGVNPRTTDEYAQQLADLYRIYRSGTGGHERFLQGLQKMAAELQEVPVTTADNPLKWTEIDVTPLPQNQFSDEYDRVASMAFCKFRSPLDVPADLHWSFAVPENLGRWYILPVKGAMTEFGSFQQTRDLLATGVPLPLGSLFVFQELLDGPIEPGQEYIIGFFPAFGVDRRLFAGIRLTPRGTHQSTDDLSQLRQIVNPILRSTELPQSPAGLRAGFDAAARMSGFYPADSAGIRRLLRSLWTQIPEIKPTVDGNGPVWNRVNPDMSFRFNAVRIKSTISQAADVNWTFVQPGDQLRSGIISKDKEFQRPETFRLQVNLPIAGVAHPEKNLVFLQTLAKQGLRSEEELVFWFAPHEKEGLPTLDVAVRLSPASSLEVSDNAQSIGNALGLSVPETPSPEQVAAAFQRCHNLIEDATETSWPLVRLVEFTAPALPWIETNEGAARWVRLEMNAPEQKFAAFRVGQHRTEHSRVAAVLAHPPMTFGNKVIDADGKVTTLDGQRVSWGFISSDREGFWNDEEHRHESAVPVAGVRWPASTQMSFTVINEWDFEDPLIVIVNSLDPGPVTVSLTAKATPDVDATQLKDLSSVIEQLDLQQNRAADPGGILGEHQLPVLALRFVSDELLLSASRHGSAFDQQRDPQPLIVWNTKDRSEAATVDWEGISHVSAFSTDGKTVAVSSFTFATLEVFNLGSPEKKTELQAPHERFPRSLAFSPDKRYLFGAYNGERFETPNKSAIYTWDLLQPGAPKVQEFPIGVNFRSLCVLPDGQVVVAGNQTEPGKPARTVNMFMVRDMEAILKSRLGMGELRFVDPESLAVKESLKDEFADWSVVTNSADGSRLAAWAGTGLIKIWDLKTKQPLMIVPESEMPNELWLSEDGRRMATMTDSGAVRVWDLDARRLLRHWPVNKPEFTAIALSPSGKQVALAGKDRRVRLFDVDGPMNTQIKSDGSADLSNALGMEFNLIPAGTFTMGRRSDPRLPAVPGGTPPREADQEPQHDVRLINPFYLGRHEVTVAQFRKFVDATGYRTTAETLPRGGSHIFANREFFKDRADLNWKNPGFPQKDNHPVGQISFFDAVAFCEWLSKQEGVRYRLPTEAEWEYACRAGTTGPCYYGSSIWGTKFVNLPDLETSKAYGQYDLASRRSDGFAFTSPVGTFPPNGFGLFDMYGNNMEWCSDWYKSDYYQEAPEIDPAGPHEGAYRIQRGGGCLIGVCTSPARDYGDCDQTQSQLGFRVVRVVDASKK